MIRQGLYKLREVKSLSTGEENIYYKHLFFKTLICYGVEVGRHTIFIEPNTFTSFKSGIVKATIDKFNGNDLIIITECNVFVLTKLKND